MVLSVLKIKKLVFYKKWIMFKIIILKVWNAKKKKMQINKKYLSEWKLQSIRMII